MARKNKDTGGYVIEVAPLRKGWSMVEECGTVMPLLPPPELTPKDYVKSMARHKSRSGEDRTIFVSPNGMRLNIKAVAIL